MNHDDIERQRDVVVSEMCDVVVSEMCDSCKIVQCTAVQPGDWLLMTYVIKPKIMYVLETDDRGAFICSPDWLVNSAVYVTYVELKQDARHIGRGNYRWWWRFLPWRQFVLPFSRPRRFFWI